MSSESRTVVQGLVSIFLRTMNYISSTEYNIILIFTERMRNENVIKLQRKLWWVSKNSRGYQKLYSHVSNAQMQSKVPERPNMWYILKRRFFKDVFWVSHSCTRSSLRHWSQLLHLFHENQFRASSYSWWHLVVVLETKLVEAAPLSNTGNSNRVMSGSSEEKNWDGRLFCIIHSSWREDWHQNWAKHGSNSKQVECSAVVAHHCTGGASRGQIHLGTWL